MATPERYLQSGPQEIRVKPPQDLESAKPLNIIGDVRAFVMEEASHEIVESKKRAEICRCWDCTREAALTKEWWKAPKEVIKEMSKADLQ